MTQTESEDYPIAVPAVKMMQNVLQ